MGAVAPGRGRVAGAVRSELGRQAGWGGGGGDGRHRGRVGLCRDALAPVRGWQPLWRADRRGDHREGWRRARIFRRAFSRQQRRSPRGSGRHRASGPRAGLSLLPSPPLPLPGTLTSPRPLCLVLAVLLAPRGWGSRRCSCRPGVCRSIESTSRSFRESVLNCSLPARLPLPLSLG